MIINGHHHHHHHQASHQSEQQLQPLNSLTVDDNDDLHCSSQREEQHQPPHVLLARTASSTTTMTIVMDERQPLLPLYHSGSSDSTSFAPQSSKSSYDYYLSCCSLRRWALELSLYLNLIICLAKLIAYLKSLSLSVLAALVDSVLDVVSQLVLYYTERHSTFQRRSSALYPAGASRLEPIGVLTCAALMGMASFEVIKESVERLLYFSPQQAAQELLNYNMASVWSMIVIVGVKLALWVLCKRAARDHVDGVMIARAAAAAAAAANNNKNVEVLDMKRNDCDDDDMENNNNDAQDEPERNATYYSFMSDPTLEALAQDHWNDTLSNGIAAFALISTLRYHALWFLDPVGAILISIYIIRSWYHTGKEQIEQLTGRGAPDEFIDELLEIANSFDDRMVVDVCRAYHFGPKFLVELEVVLPKDTVLFESHDLGMELQYEIESRPEVERCFVHIDYEQRPYDEHVVSKVPELREKYKQQQRGMFGRATRSL